MRANLLVNLRITLITLKNNIIRVGNTCKSKSNGYFLLMTKWFNVKTVKTKCFHKETVTS